MRPYGKPLDKWWHVLEQEWDVHMEGNEKADELAKEGASLDGGFLAEIRAQDVKKKQEERFNAAVKQAAFSLANVEGWNLCQ